MTRFDATTSAFLPPTLLNSWVNYGAPYQLSGVQRVGTRVTLRGVVKNGTANAALFVLGAGYRPAKQEIFVVMGTGGIPVRLDVLADGTVMTTGASGNTYLSLSGVFFDVTL